MKVFLFLLVLLLIVMETLSWRTYQRAKTEKKEVLETIQGERVSAIRKETGKRASAPMTPGQLSLGDEASFPPPTTAVVNGVTERTIHVGVRQWAWDPDVLRVKEGELVRLIIHNADVKHGLVIPALGVDQDIPPDGAVVEFTASKKGTFEFFCSVWCGEGHMEMQGKIIIE
ncbi:MAG: cupredoxin domain-containing protein [Candidatus Moranbacteria bacterium]|nr:cupredoxin domain-containing protein [Candidatus Moranbacteria bacterium]